MSMRLERIILYGKVAGQTASYPHDSVELSGRAENVYRRLTDLQLGVRAIWPSHQGPYTPTVDDATAFMLTQSPDEVNLQAVNGVLRDLGLTAIKESYGDRTKLSLDRAA